MRVRPAQGGLENQMQPVETQIERHLKAPEDRRFDVRAGSENLDGEISGVSA
jgi:hypothetical protein